jgi:hypothetical protein
MPWSLDMALVFATRSSRRKARGVGRAAGRQPARRPPAAFASRLAVAPGPSALAIQRRLEIGEPNDRFEQEANRVADQVMRMADPQRARPLIRSADEAPDRVQRLCAACEEELRRQPIEDEEDQLQMTGGSGATAEIGADLQARIAGLRGGGQPLSPSLRGFFEPRFGHDFGQVRLHHGAQAADSARALRARAFTAGSDIVFGAGEYPPTTAGLSLLAHELTHVIQQRRGATAGQVQRQACQAIQSDAHVVKKSELLSIAEVAAPCYACPNSNPDACPKLAQKIFPPIATGPVQFSWQVRFNSFYREKGIGKPGRGKNTHVIQRIQQMFNFTTPPANPYPYTPVYWEAFELDDHGQTEVDYWQFEIPDLTAGSWTREAALYFTDQLPGGMAAGNVPEASGAAATTNEPKGLGRILGTRQIAGMFDFTQNNKWHR